LRAIQFHLSDSEPILAASAVVACSAGGGGSARLPGETPDFNRFVSPGQRDERRHRQTHFVLGAKRSRVGALPGLSFAGSVTARDRVGGSTWFSLDSRFKFRVTLICQCSTGAAYWLRPFALAVFLKE
jgi:hypothetical protein